MAKVFTSVIFILLFFHPFVLRREAGMFRRCTPLFALTLACLVICSQRTYACFCVRPEVPESFKQAKSVFLGEVVDIVEPKTSDETAPLPDRFFKIKFKVQRSWKGVPYGAREFSVLSAQGRYGCFAFPPVTKGEMYLVYADSAYRAENWGIITVCTRTTAVRFGSNPRLPDPEGIDPFSDMKRLDIITKRIHSFDRAQSRRRV
jgi:hypothetical protein